ncbi:MAG: acetyl-CoA carboxylase carboxyl transferase subunit alpha, partial [Clostridiales bacterium]|nr:acetyl-CoA carboxylase carboxyl transferase subunit alpha [Clostridiales bacterium]
KEASECLKLTAEDLLGFGVIEKIIPENDKTAETLKTELERFTQKKSQCDLEDLTRLRYARFRKMGVFQ